MPALINKSSEISDLNWEIVETPDQLADITEGAALACSLALWQSLSNDIQAKQPKDLQLLLLGHDEIEPISDQLKKFSLISIDFKEFKDGRGYSLARLLRERYGYRGELRATGDVTHDQLFYLNRCGFDTFLLRADQEPSRALKAFSDFSEVYQAAVDEPKPIYQR